jgi:hypothetical protein
MMGDWNSCFSPATKIVLIAADMSGVWDCPTSIKFGVCDLWHIAQHLAWQDDTASEVIHGLADRWSLNKEAR